MKSDLEIAATNPRAQRRVVIAAAVVGAAALAGALAWWFAAPAHEGVRLSAAARGFPWARAPMAPAGDAAETVSADVPAAEGAASSAGLQAPARPAGPTTMDLCGVGRVAVPAQASAPEGGLLPGLPAAMGRYALQDAQARLVQALGAGDARQRVAARLLQQPDDLDPGRQAAWARSLLAEGLASRDAQALRWASAACPFVADEAACRRRLARERVQVEPANALHWLEWADAEPAAMPAAWAGLARARYWREQPLALAGLAVRSLGTDIPAYLHATLAMEAMMRDAAFPAPPLEPVLERCGPRPGGPGAAGGAGAAGECERLARLLVEQSDSVQGLMLGRELGAHIGWPAERLQRLDAEVEELQKQEHHWAVDERRPLGCATVEGQQEHIVSVEREGELEALRRSAAASPGSPAPSSTPAAPRSPTSNPLSPQSPTPTPTPTPNAAPPRR